MGHSQAEKTQTHERVVKIAARLFREAGLDGVSIADLMKEAGLTHGGFYKHFASRDDLVTEAVAAALANGSTSSKVERPKRSLREIIEGYLSRKHRDAPGEGCAVGALLNDMSRANDEAKRLYAQRVVQNLDGLSQALKEGTKRERRANAILALSAMTGALGLARAVPDKALSDEILTTVCEALIKNLSA